LELTEQDKEHLPEDPRDVQKHLRRLKLNTFPADDWLKRMARGDPRAFARNRVKKDKRGNPQYDRKMLREEAQRFVPILEPLVDRGLSLKERLLWGRSESSLRSLSRERYIAFCS